MFFATKSRSVHWPVATLATLPMTSAAACGKSTKACATYMQLLLCVPLSCSGDVIAPVLYAPVAPAQPPPATCCAPVRLRRSIWVRVVRMARFVFGLCVGRVERGVGLPLAPLRLLQLKLPPRRKWSASVASCLGQAWPRSWMSWAASSVCAVCVCVWMWVLCVCVCVCVSARVFYMPSKRPFSPWSQLVAGKQQAQAGTQPCGAFPVLAGCSYALPLKMSHSHATYTHTHTRAASAELWPCARVLQQQQEQRQQEQQQE